MLLSDASTSHSLFRRIHLDPPLLAALLLLAGVGLVILFSASGGSEAQIWRQLTRLGISFGVMLLLAQVSPDTLLRWTHWIFGFGLIMLIAVLIVGDVGKGAQRWLAFGGIRFQPSELMKLAVPMMVAWYFAEKSLPAQTRHSLVALAIVVVPTLLIAKQPDLGTAVLIASSGLFILLFAGLSWRLVGFATLLALPLGWLLWQFGMHDYQRRRVLTFLNPESDPLGSGYHIIQSKIAIGSGGLYGKGWLNGTQSHLEFLPERHTDFIFAVFSEEFGLMGVLLLLAIYLLIVLRGLYIASQAQDTFSRLLAGGLSMTFMVYVFVNIGMVTGLLPVVGVPLPLVSYGGSSMVTLMAAFGILMSIHTHRKLLKN
ncbi:MAG: rod shape-determining protein RodA [Gammaproteobacteria bacterium]|nr:rod shape-determining protein RodA [Gammaproteobacteria bacterium]MCW8972661.1 rod shape-determining protein RodA [Gammaproteobacteria bacterium]MCW8992374.1 rod shape-determining protein RodA [Gammaproteobacteria bacterium]